VPLRDLALLPRLADGWTFLYVEHVRIDQEEHAIVLWDQAGRTPVPIAALSVLLLGPGTTVTHAAMLALAENGCAAVWCGDGVVRFYAAGLGETRRAGNLLAQARAWAEHDEHLRVVTRMYARRFEEPLDAGLTLQQIRGMEGVRVREVYARASREYGVPWHGRSYDPGRWGAADPVNRALSAANACLYGLCHAAIVATGFAPGLGFVHTGKALAFVYDIADLYKADTTIPAAFAAVAENTGDGLEARVRRRCRDVFRASRLLERIVPDIQAVLGLKEEAVAAYERQATSPDVTRLWNGDDDLPGGQNYAPTEEELELLAATRHLEPAPPNGATAPLEDDDADDFGDALR
jgi:CRISPR-associated protein Cas1